MKRMTKGKWIAIACGVLVLLFAFWYGGSAPACRAGPSGARAPREEAQEQQRALWEEAQEQQRRAPREEVQEQQRRAPREEAQEQQRTPREEAQEQ